ncbi:MAG: hypothetical protein ACI4PA_06225, partial [Oscillospiraceae bacterium]
RRCGVQAVAQGRQGDQVLKQIAKITAEPHGQNPRGSAFPVTLRQIHKKPCRIFAEIRQFS